MALSGRKFIFGFAAVIAVVALFGFFTLRKASDRRFAISIHMIPDSTHEGRISLHRPILVRIDKRSAGRSPFRAFALLFDGNGRPLPEFGTEMRPLIIRELPTGKRTEEVDFPPLTTLPGQRLLAAVVVRLPESQIDVARTRLPDAIHLDLEQQTKDALPRVFGRILSLSRNLGGHAELTQAEVRDKL